MRIVVQRASKGRVLVDEQVTGEIGRGFVLLVGVTHEDTEKDADYLAEKIMGLRIFEDAGGKMNLSLLDVEGAILSVSQFTLYGDCRKGRRPNFMEAARPEQANRLYEYFNEKLRSLGARVETGVFGAMMDVELVNDGPVTLLLDSKKNF
ncbi:D-aminoacyl-tRNA deacylase [Effusibacillus lacus]|uniref:D-aminoacyl-tRNA deacylase n=1 Tax=Effusibacillus lacus TaxID=1348429 RepID=A0A292YNE7_9BACL|nr:D-aminoacyl-tRNA deacylase [Effusibacillus lacus]TCS68977.1 D-tyrosyl-tRNA(Tyr) deacylase [Effusibacillus lacus]GAX91458.1 D-tyrosyl-tRNA(Tyr) deacylase [Effusibacillus lacus]